VSSQGRTAGRTAVLLVVAAAAGACGRGPGDAAERGKDAEVTSRGTVEVTARLDQIPEGAIFKRELYNYATILRYRVLEVHRGTVNGQTIYVGHYNPFKPRSEAADRRVSGIGGDLRRFRSGQVHRMALEAPLEDHYMGAIVNKYFGTITGPLYWAVWTNEAEG
jgi:hypothetical protein